MTYGVCQIGAKNSLESLSFLVNFSPVKPALGERFRFVTCDETGKTLNLAIIKKFFKKS
ncbi:MAG: hypothetical protein K2O64_00995 [Lactobacillus sp.]|nr:hypothetical protein [Lactobacillus sp.]